MLSGSVNDYGASEQNAIKSTFANAAGVSAADIVLEITSASVNVKASIKVTDAGVAAATSSSLNAGILQSPATLSTALQQSGNAQLQGATVVSATAPVTREVSSSSNQGSSNQGSSNQGSSNPSSDAEDPCFPSTAMITRADGTKAAIASLRPGDAIVAVTSDGFFQTDVVSVLSIAKAVDAVAFLTLMSHTGDNITLTASHHLSVGAACCATLKPADAVEVGETLWRMPPMDAQTIAAGDAVPQKTRIVKITKTIKAGLHSPVLMHGGFPVVDAFVTSFDSVNRVMLAKYALPLATSVCEATGTCALLRRAIVPAGEEGNEMN